MNTIYQLLCSLHRRQLLLLYFFTAYRLIICREHNCKGLSAKVSAPNHGLKNAFREVNFSECNIKHVPIGLQQDRVPTSSMFYLHAIST